MIKYFYTDSKHILKIKGNEEKDGTRYLLFSWSKYKETQKRLSEITFYSYEFIRKIESKSACRNTFSLDTVDKIAKALDINIKILFEPLDESKIS